MYKEKIIAVVVPAYKVAPHILLVLKTIPSFVDRILVVDDCSSDGTDNLLLQVQDKRVTVIRHSFNQGVGGAMVTGFRQVLTESIDFIVKVDGDGQMDPDYIPTLLDPLVDEGFGCAKGNRFLHSDRLRAMPAYRLIGNYALTFLTKWASGYWHIFDPQNGFIVIRAEIVKQLELDHLTKRYFFENDMLVHLNILNVRVKDVPIPARYGQEKSSMRLWEVLLTFPWYLFRRFWYRVYQKHILRDFSPVALFWVFGMSLFFWGLCFGTYTWARSIIFHEVATTGTVMLSVLPFLLGFELILQGMILEIKESPK
jgi:glycosyltransferase involved in cell wall biosynthesis